MLTIRREQKQALDALARENFLERMVQHIRSYFPAHHAELKDAGCRELVELAIERAGRHGFVSERDVCKFVNLMLSFGVEFDEDPAHTPWIEPILHDYRNAPRSACMKALYAAARRVAQAAADAR